MAGGGIGEAALIGAAIGGGTSMVAGGDPLKGALLGGLTGGAGGALFGGAGAGLAGTEAAASGALGSVGMGPTAPVLDAALAGSGGAGAAGTASGGISNLLSGLSTGQKAALGAGSLGLASMMQKPPSTAAAEKYSGPLSRFSYNPETYTPYTYQPYAAGGPVEAMSNANAIGANTGYPMADVQQGAYATPYQQPIAQNVVTGAQDTRVDAYTGQERLAGGGIASLGGYSDGGQLLRGPGDGVSDSIPAMIGNKQPARLADGEFVVPARIVSELGNGSTDAGARKLYDMMDRVQRARGKTTGKKRVAANTRADKYLPA